MILDPSTAPGFIASAIATEFEAQGLVLFDPLHPERGTGIVLDDGREENDEGVEAALQGANGKGLVVVVMTFASGSVEDSVHGAANFSASFDVVVRENVKRNRGDGGTGLRCDTALVRVVRSVIGAATGAAVHRSIGVRSIRNNRIEAGTWTCAATFSVPVTIK